MSEPVHDPEHESENESVNEGTATDTLEETQDKSGSETPTDVEAPEAPEAPEDVVDTDEVATPTDPVEDDAAESDRPSRRARLEQEGEIAADYLEELLEIADLDGDLDMDVEGDRATVSIVGANLPQLVGDQGEVLEALQELTRLAVYRETGERSRLMLDVSGHRAERRTALEEQAAEVVAQVKASGEQATLEPMSPFERKVVHDVVAAAGLKSESEGAEPRRYVVVLPA
jgi:spoIIIJ-associated protein